MLRLLNLLGLLLAVVWLARNPDWEPAVAVVGLLSVLLAQEWSTSRSSRIAPGLKAVYTRFTQDIDWHPLFTGVTELDLFISYGSTWRHTVHEDLSTVAANRKARVRIVLPDPNNPDLISELSRRFAIEPEALKGRLDEAVKEFKDIFQGSACQFQLICIPTAPVYTYYRFNQRILVAFYKNQTRRADVPALLLTQGPLYDFFYNDFSAMLAELAKPEIG